MPPKKSGNPVKGVSASAGGSRSTTSSSSQSQEASTSGQNRSHPSQTGSGAAQQAEKEPPKDQDACPKSQYTGPDIKVSLKLDFYLKENPALKPRPDHVYIKKTPRPTRSEYLNDEAPFRCK
jgi:hypothetical protein